jgi:alkaline phosphatase D
VRSKENTTMNIDECLGALSDASLHAARRRRLLRGLTALPLLGFRTPSPAAQAPLSKVAFGDQPFALGVASGDPSPDGFVIWTRLAPKPLQMGGGLPKRAIEVTWLVATDEQMQQVIRKGTAVAYPEAAHAVHVEVDGLQPGREYFYRFVASGEASAVGRAKTLPAPGSLVAEVRFAAAGCQWYEEGYYTAWRHIASQRLDFVFHYGDYIYEYAPGANRKVPIVRTPPGVSERSYSLDEYRIRYAAYKLDPDLQAAHVASPFVVSFDDHEVDNNWAGDVSGRNTPVELFLLRRASAFQAWYEHMPLRRSQIPRGPDVLAHRRLQIGNLLTVNVLDTRQYRSDQPCGDGTRADCAEARDPSRTMLGAAQEKWLYDSFRRPAGRWTLLAQQVPIVQRDVDPDPAVYRTSMDKWDGAVAARDRLLAAVAEARLGNLVVATGDVHHHCAGELKRDFADPASATLGVEFIGTSISSGGDGADTTSRFKALLLQNPHVKFYNNQRGYVRHVVGQKRWQADYQVVDKVSVRDGSVSTRASFVVEDGRPGLTPA